MQVSLEVVRPEATTCGAKWLVVSRGMTVLESTVRLVFWALAALAAPDAPPVALEAALPPAALELPPWPPTASELAAALLRVWALDCELFEIGPLVAMPTPEPLRSGVGRRAARVGDQGR